MNQYSMGTSDESYRIRVAAALRSLQCGGGVIVTDDAVPEDLCSPGHVFPLKARRGGVLERPGHTEATVDLMSLAGLKPCGVLCELTNPDGSMARSPELGVFSKQHAIPMITVRDIIHYRQDG